MEYKAVIQEFDRRGIKVVRRKCYDHQSGWTGEDLYLKDSNGYLNSSGSYSQRPISGTLNLSGNGYCFREDTVAEVMKQVEQFYLLDDVKDFESFSKYIKEVAEGDAVNYRLPID